MFYHIVWFYMSKGFQGLEHNVWTKNLNKKTWTKNLNKKLEQKTWTKNLNKELEHNTKRSVFKFKKLKNKRENSFSKSVDWNRILHEPSSVFKFKEFKNKRENSFIIQFDFTSAKVYKVLKTISEQKTWTKNLNTILNSQF